MGITAERRGGGRQLRRRDARRTGRKYISGASWCRGSARACMPGRTRKADRAFFSNQDPPRGADGPVVWCSYACNRQAAAVQNAELPATYHRLFLEVVRVRLSDLCGRSRHSMADDRAPKHWAYRKHFLPITHSSQSTRRYGKYPERPTDLHLPSLVARYFSDRVRRINIQYVGSRALVAQLGVASLAAYPQLK